MAINIEELDKTKENDIRRKRRKKEMSENKKIKDGLLDVDKALFIYSLSVLGIIGFMFCGRTVFPIRTMKWTVVWGCMFMFCAIGSRIAWQGFIFFKCFGQFYMITLTRAYIIDIFISPLHEIITILLILSGFITDTDTDKFLDIIMLSILGFIASLLLSFLCWCWTTDILEKLSKMIDGLRLSRNIAEVEAHKILYQYEHHGKNDRKNPNINTIFYLIVNNTCFMCLCLFIMYITYLHPRFTQTHNLSARHNATN